MTRLGAHYRASPGGERRSDSSSRLVQTLGSPEGADVLWNLKNADGHSAASGVYFYFINTTACDQKKKGKLVLIL